MQAEFRLRKHADYQSVYQRGRKHFGKQMSYFYAIRNAECDVTGPRVGLTVGKVMGKAVDRNRIKRRMRAAVSDSLQLLTAQVDVVLHPKRSVMECEYQRLVEDVATVFRAVQKAAVKVQKPEAETRA